MAHSYDKILLNNKNGGTIATYNINGSHKKNTGSMRPGIKSVYYIYIKFKNR